MKQLLFGLHLPVIGFSSDHGSTSNNNGGSNNSRKNGVKEKQQKFTRGN
jgi:hypothetical protein